MGEITTLLRELAAKLGTTVEHLWAVLIRQAYIEGIKAIILFTISIPIFFIWLRFFKRRDKSDEDKRFGIGPEPGWWITGFMAGVLVLGLAVNAISSIDNFFNPEYWALQKILRQIR